MLRSLTILASFIFISFLSQENLSAQWVQTNGPTGQVYSIAAKGDTLFVATYVGIFQSIDDGANWTNLNNDITTSVSQVIVIGNNILAGGYRGMSISTNNGKHWSAINIGKRLSPILSFATDGVNIFLGTDSNGIFISRDSGLTWATHSKGLPYITHAIINGRDTTYPAINGLFIDNSEIYAISNNGWGTQGSGLFISSDYGSTWVSDTTLNAGYGILAIFLSQDNLLVGTDGNSMFRSSNNGVNWSSNLSGIPVNSIVSSFIGIGKTVFAGFDENGIYSSTDGGESWVAINDGLTDLAVQKVFIKGQYLFTGTDNSGIWRRPLSEITAVNENPTASPAQFSLSQNYPNPFDAATTISYSLPEAGHVTLKVYNTVGEEVATLVNEENTAGSHSATFNALNVQNGIYFYTLTAGKYSQTGKMAVVK